MTWCQYTALFRRVEIEWTDLDPAGTLMRYINVPIKMTLINTRPECALSYKVRWWWWWCHVQIDYFVMNFATTLIPFILAFIVVLYYVIVRFWSGFIRCLGRKQLTAVESSQVTGKSLFFSGFSRPLTRDMVTRLKVIYGISLYHLLVGCGACMCHCHLSNSTACTHWTCRYFRLHTRRDRWWWCDMDEWHQSW